MKSLALALALACALLGLPTLASADVDYRFPGSDDHRQHFYITAYRDLSGAGNGLLDWGCGTKTYDGHRGTDMGVGSFPGMDAGRDVVAAADGIVTTALDGFFDRCTTGNCAGGGGFGNYVAVEHADGKITYYGHLKKFSVAVAVGDAVTCGQKLGQVGSSGSSTGPHLHFEPRLGGVSDDPFSGSCGGPTSWWVDQGDYLGLPQTVCENAPPAHPLLTMGAELERAGPDSSVEANSEGVFEITARETFTAAFLIKAEMSAAKSPNVVLGVEAPGELLNILDWQILDDHEGNACGGEFCPNDANENPINPPRERPGEILEFHLNAVSPGETKKLVLTLEAGAATQVPPAAVQVWVKEVEGTYEKASFDAPPTNVDQSQTFNGGDLAQQLVFAIVPAADGEDDGLVTPGEEDLAGGCGIAGNRGAGGPLALLLGLCLLRRRRHHPAPLRQLERPAVTPSA